MNQEKSGLASRLREQGNHQSSQQTYNLIMVQDGPECHFKFTSYCGLVVNLIIKSWYCDFHSSSETCFSTNFCDLVIDFIKDNIVKNIKIMYLTLYHSEPT